MFPLRAARSRYAHEKDHDALVAELVKQIEAAKFGDGLEQTTTRGPLNNQMQLDIVSEFVEEAGV